MDRFALLKQVSEGLVEARDLDAMLRGLAQALVPAIADVCVVRLGSVDGPEGDDLDVAWVQADTHAHASAFQAAIARRATCCALAARGGELVADCAASPAAAALHAAGVRSYLCVPLVARGRVHGALSLGSFERSLGESEVELVELVAGLTCFAVQSERLRARSAGTERALREREAELTAIVEGALDAILVADDDGRYLSANGAAAALIGCARAEVVGMSFMDLSPARQEDAAAWRRFRAEGAVQRGTWRIRRPDGEEREVEYAATPNITPGKHLATFRDVTERRRLEEQLNQAQKMEAIGRLAGGVAHDFNNLLTVINGYTELMLGALSAHDPLRRHAEQVRRAGERAGALTQQLLAFSRRQVLQPRVVNLNAVVGDLTRMLRRMVGEDIDVRTRLAPELWNVRADPQRIEQVLMNLVVNARDAMPVGGGLVLETRNVSLDREIIVGTRNAVLDGAYARRHPEVAPGDYVILSVSDTGSGMDAATMAHLFEPFFTTKGGRGTGLGLSTAYGIVKQSGGHIFVYSEVGAGTTFKVYLPRVREALTPAAPPTPPAAPGRDEVVLVVEDDDTVRELVATALHGHGYRTIEARNGGEALLICERQDQRIDLLLTDVIMPRMTGPELVARLACVRPGLRALYMSGYTDDALAVHGVVEPGAGFVEKPFTPVTLARAVREALDLAGSGRGRVDLA